MTKETEHFIATHLHDDVRQLALKAACHPDVDMTEAVIQIAGRQTAEKKVPTWAAVEGIRYPVHLSMEQCSSEATARLKASLVRGKSFADLTGGFGIDCSFVARSFSEAHYVERQEALCELARHNFPLIGLPHVQVHHADGIAYLRSMQTQADCLFLDPARRDSHGGKTVAIADCEPDVSLLEPLLVEKGRTVMIKLSPMLDMGSALQGLKYLRRLFTVAVNNECKELIALLKREPDQEESTKNEVIISCEQSVDNFTFHEFSFTLSEEREAICPLADTLETYLYEPGAALLKAGPYRLIALRYGLKKLHPNSHLYTSDRLIDFPGRRFRVESASGFGKRELKSLLQGVEKANLTVRNFPTPVAELRKRLKLKEGGDIYLFATTLATGEKVLVKCARL